MERHLGLKVNSAKCELLILTNDAAFRQKTIDDFKSISSDIRILGSEDTSLLGSPLTEEAFDQIFSNKIENFKILCKHVVKLDAHDALFLIKNCFAIPKLLHC